MKALFPILAAGLALSVAAPGAESPGAVDRAAAIGLEFGPDTTVITQPRSADGLPDYVAALNQQLAAGVAKDENFWVLMWPALGNAERSSETFVRQVEQQLGITIARQPRLSDVAELAGVKYGTPEGDAVAKQQSQAMFRPWSRQEFPAIARWVDAHAAVLDEVHAACRRPKAYAPLIAGDGRPAVVQVLLPHVQSLRAAARLLAARAMLRLGEGDMEGSWHDLVAMQQLARHSERGFTLIEALVGYAIRSIALQPTAHWIAGCGLSMEELEPRRAALRGLTGVESLARSMDCERYMYLDVVVCLMSGAATSGETMQLFATDVSGLDEATSGALQQLRNARDAIFHLLLSGSDVNATLRYGNRIYNDLVAAMQPESHLERQARLQAIEQLVGKNAEFTRDTGAIVKAYLFSSREQLKELPGKALTGLLIPAVSNVEKAQTRAETLKVLIDAAFAAQMHFMRTGEVPGAVDELIAKDGTALVDPYVGRDLLIKADAAGLTLYSLGANGRDDGGRNPDDGPGLDDIRVILPMAP